MAALFLSHSSQDGERSREIAAWLRAQGFESLFLDVDPEAGLVGGRQWERQLYARLRQCRAVLVLCSQASLDSRWCFAEITQARALGKALVPLRLAAGEVVPDILRELQVVDLTTPTPDAWQQLKAALDDLLGPRDALRWDGSRPPYPGLLAFDEADAAIYFGRDAEVRDALAQLNRQARLGAARVLLVLGVSGSGKSSLVRAGMLPALRRDRRAWRVIEPFRPLRDPFAELARSLRSEADWTAAERGTLKAGAMGAPDFIDKLRDAGPAAETTTLLVIDQLEELLAADTPAAAAFSAWLIELLEIAEGCVMLLGTLRSDQLGRLQTHALGALPYGDIGLGPLPRTGIVEIVEGPAQLAGLELEAGLVEELVADTGAEDALPLLAFALRELWERGGDDGRLTIAEYTEGLGRLSGALARAADAVLSAQRLDEAQTDLLRAALLRLVRLDDEGRSLRQRARRDALPDAAQALLEPFVRARLLVAGAHEGARTVEVAHEALFRAWRLLDGWIAEHRALLRSREALRRAAADWRAAQARGDHSSLLVHRGSRLEDAEALLTHPAIALSGDERDYLAACLAARERERAEETARQQRELDAERERRAESERLGAIAEAELYVSLLMLAQQYVERGQYELALTALDDCPPTRRHWEWGYLLRLARLELPLSWQATVAIDDSPLPRDTGDAFDLHRWRWPDGPAARPRLRPVRAQFGGPLYSPDGRWAVDRVTQGPQTRVRLSEAMETTAEFLIEHDLGPHESYGVNACFSPDSRRLATSSGPLARIWDCESADLLCELRGHRDTVWGLAFSPDGQRLVTTADDGSARVWDAASGRALVTLVERARWRFEPRPSGLALSMYGNREGASWRHPGFSEDGRTIVVETGYRGPSSAWTAWPDDPDIEAARDREALHTLAGWQPQPPADERPVRRVRSADAFIRALQPDTIIEIDSTGPLDLGGATHPGHLNAQWLPANQGRTLTLRDLPNLCIRPSRRWPRATITTPDTHAFVLHFERCDGLELRSLTLGHAPEAGGCDRGVLGLSDSSGIRLDDCDLYGCGTEGLTASNVSWLHARALVIRDCTYGVLTLDHCNFIHFDGARLAGNQEYWGLRITRSRDLLFSDCEIAGNRCGSEPLFDLKACRNLLLRGGLVAGNEAGAWLGAGGEDALRCEGVRFGEDQQFADGGPAQGSQD